MFENKALIVTRCQRRFFVFFRILFMLYDESALSGLFGLFSPNRFGTFFAAVFVTQMLTFIFLARRVF